MVKYDNVTINTFMTNEEQGKAKAKKRESCEVVIILDENMKPIKITKAVNVVFVMQNTSCCMNHSFSIKMLVEDEQEGKSKDNSFTNVSEDI